MNITHNDCTFPISATDPAATIAAHILRAHGLPFSIDDLDELAILAAEKTGISALSINDQIIEAMDDMLPFDLIMPPR